MAVIDSAVALGALPSLDAAEAVLDLTDLSPNLAQAMLQAKLSALAAVHSTTGYAYETAHVICASSVRGATAVMC